MRLLSKIIIKDFSEGQCFVLDLEDDSDAYFKCVDVFAELMQHIHRLENFTAQSLVEFLKTQYADVEEAQLSKDVDAFISFLKEKNFVAE
jgi:hypothetical protein